MSSDVLETPRRSSLADISPAEWQARRDLAACFRLVALNGEDDLVANHITVAVPGEPGAFLINPFNLFMEEMTASALVKIDGQGNILSETEYEVNATGFVIHGAIHEARPDAVCVLHLHTNAGVALSTLNTELMPSNQTAMTIYDDIAYHEYEGLALNDEERATLVKDLGDKHIMMLRNHGTLTIGRSVAEAWLRHYFLERSAKVQLMAMAATASGATFHEADPAIAKSVADMFRRFSDKSSNQLIWPAILRKLDRICPDYKY